MIVTYSIILDECGTHATTMVCPYCGCGWTNCVVSTPPAAAKVELDEIDLAAHWFTRASSRQGVMRAARLAGRGRRFVVARDRRGSPVKRERGHAFGHSPRRRSAR